MEKERFATMARPPHKRQKTAATSQPPHPIRKLPDTKKIAVLKLKEELVDSNGKDSNEQPCWSSSADVSLASLIAPLDQHAFLQHCFRECAVHVPADTEVDRMSGVREELFDLDPESILEATSSESVFVWIQRQKNVQNGNLIQSIEVSDSDAALALYKAGHATYCRAPPVVEQNLVSSLLSGTGRFSHMLVGQSGSLATSHRPVECFSKVSVVVSTTHQASQ